MSAESLEWSKAAETAPEEEMKRNEDYRASRIKEAAEKHNIDLDDLNTLHIDRGDDHVGINGSVGGQNISLTRTVEGVSGSRGDKALATHEAEVEYLRLAHALAQREQANDYAIGRTIDEIDKHHRVLTQDLDEKAKPVEGAEKSRYGANTLKVGNITYELREVLRQDTLEILRDGFQLAIEAAERSNGLPYSSIPFTITLEDRQLRVSYPAELNGETRIIRGFDSSPDRFKIPAGAWTPSDKIALAEFATRNLLSHVVVGELNDYLESKK